MAAGMTDMSSSTRPRTRMESTPSSATAAAAARAETSPMKSTGTAPTSAREAAGTTTTTRTPRRRSAPSLMTPRRGGGLVYAPSTPASCASSSPSFVAAEPQSASSQTPCRTTTTPITVLLCRRTRVTLLIALLARTNLRLQMKGTPTSSVSTRFPLVPEFAVALPKIQELWHHLDNASVLNYRGVILRELKKCRTGYPELVAILMSTTAIEAVFSKGVDNSAEQGHETGDNEQVRLLRLRDLDAKLKGADGSNLLDAKLKGVDGSKL